MRRRKPRKPISEHPLTFIAILMVFYIISLALIVLFPDQRVP